MKEKRTNKLSCERARAFPIEKALAKLGHFPAKSTEKEAWFLSPFRPETQASFKVSKKLNRWYDHGEGTGGNVIDLICKVNDCSVSEALRTIAQDQTSFSFHRRQIFKEKQQHKIIIKEIKDLTHFALKAYLKSRNISILTANKLIREVHYDFKDKYYFAVGFRNNSEGWELRNKYFKNSSSPKDITHIKNGKDKLIVIEGMFDLLSVYERDQKIGAQYDFLVLNSTAFVQRAIKHINGYVEIKLYLDNDENGKRATQKFMEHFKNCADESALYKNYKDINEWLMASSDVIGQGI